MNTFLIYFVYKLIQIVSRISHNIFIMCFWQLNLCIFMNFDLISMNDDWTVFNYYSKRLFKNVVLTPWSLLHIPSLLVSKKNKYQEVEFQRVYLLSNRSKVIKKKINNKGCKKRRYTEFYIYFSETVQVHRIMWTPALPQKNHQALSLPILQVYSQSSQGPSYNFYCSVFTSTVFKNKYISSTRKETNLFHFHGRLSSF